MRSHHFVSDISRRGPRRKIALLAGALYAAGALGGVANAQQAAPPASGAGAAAGTQPGQIAEVVVTAQRREQRLQDVPIAISAVNAQALSAVGINNTEALQTAVPGLQIPRAQFAISPRIRGVGASVVGPGQENSVAMYVDDVYIASPASASLSFNNIDHVEVLKGPQGTLFGRNATGGLIQVITKEPSLRGWEGEVKAHLGRYLETGGDVYLTGPVANNVAVSLAVQGSTQQRGYGLNIFNGSEFGRDYINFSIRGKLLWEIDEKTTLRLGVDYNQRKFDLTYILDPDFQTSPSALAALAVAKARNPLLNTFLPRGGYDENVNVPSYINQHGYGMSARLEHDFGAFGAKSITAYRSDRAPSMSSLTVTPVTVGVLGLPNAESAGVVFNTQFSQEFQIYSAKNSPITWLAGAYYFTSNYGSDPFSLTLGFPLTIPRAPSPVGAVETWNVGHGTTTSYAAYGQASYEILPKTTLTGGIRYTYERRTLSGPYYSLLSADPTGAGRNPFLVSQVYGKATHFDAPTWRASLDHRFSDAVMVYASYNTGFKSGGFDLSSPANNPFAPEKLKAYEVGVKSDLFDRRVRLNVAAFHYKYTNIQVVAQGQGVVSTTNAAGATLYGADADLAVYVTEGLHLTAGGSYSHARYTAYNNALCTITAPGPAYLVQVPCALLGRTAVGNHLQFAPTFTGNLGFTYTTPLADNSGSLELASSLYYSTEFFSLPENLQKQRQYKLLNASLTWRSPDQRYSLRVYGDNLTNTYYASQMSTINALAAYRIPGPPRTYGAEVAMKF